MDSRPFEHRSPLDTVLWQTWRVGDGTYRERGGLVEHVKRTLVTGRDCGKDDACLSLEACAKILSSVKHDWGFGGTFCAAIDERLKALLIFRVHHVDECGIHPSSGFNRVETADDNVELHVVFFTLVLDSAVVSMPDSFQVHITYSKR